MTRPAGSGLVVGVGARRGVAAAAVRALLARVAAEHGLDLTGAGFATLDTKLAEPGLVEAIGADVLLGWPAAELAGVTVPLPSGRVADAVGTPSVAEAAALYTARRRGPDATLIVPKIIGDGLTLAIARHTPAP